MDHQPMGQENNNGPWVYQSPWDYEEEKFAMPAPKQLPKQMNWKCPHCGADNMSTMAMLFHWPDRPIGKKKGYVVCCRNCGSRSQLLREPQRKPFSLGKLLPLAFVLLAAALVTFAALTHFSVLSRPNDIVVSADTSPAVSSSNLKDNSLNPDASETELAEEPEQPEPEDDTVRLLSSMRMGPISENDLDSMPVSVSTKEWDTKRVVQGVEWNKDSWDTVYFSVASYIAACEPNGEVKKEISTTGYFFSLDYYDSHLFCTWRSGKYGSFKLKVLDPVTLGEQNSINLSDIHKEFEQDKKEYGGKLCASIDGVVVAPRIGTQDELMVYVSYNSYVSKEDGMARHALQTIYEYSYEEALDPTLDKLTAKRRLRLDLGEVQYGIQTLELDRSTGNIWCAIRQGYSDYSLYLIDSKSKGTNLSLIPNGSQSGWDCPAAGDGLCSLGHDEYYLLIPDYNREDDSVSVKARRVNLSQLEGFK